MKKKQQTKILRIFMFKLIVFLEKISIDIKSFLFTTVRNNKIFVFIKDYAIDILF